MRNIIAKQIRKVAFTTVGLRTSKKRYNRYLKRRYNQLPRTERAKFFAQFTHV